jgi:hypothetical protein
MELEKEYLLKLTKSFGENYQPPELTRERINSLNNRRFGFKDLNHPVPEIPITYDLKNELWTLLSEYSYDYFDYQLVAPKGYMFDLSSIPRIFWGILAPNELSILAPLFHDIMYDYKGNLPIGYVIPYRKFTRKESDDLFLYLMKIEGVPAYRRRLAYRAVRLFNSEWEKQ